ncbi:DUF2860 family protein [Vibrio metschnikovii]|uniref:DUF2860 family protein n=1 Tax=Vibrio metschnikovii TaxID=28172 RepID=UPI001C2FFD09|nr:DUF2860 family protein [Vibrio metschnikovii]
MKKHLLLPIAFASLQSVASEIIKIPTESGFSGSLIAGVTYLDYSSNLFKGGDDSNELHNGLLNDPKNNSLVSPLFGLDLRYTYSDTRTQVFFGNLIQDAVRFDFTQQLGLRKEINNKGIVGISYVFPLIPTEAWADPYSSSTRNTTDMDSSGVRLSWDKIWNSNFNVNFTFRDYKIDKELSGNSLGLSHEEKKLLDRNGTTSDISMSYFWIRTPRSIVSPQITVGQGNFDGKSLSFNKILFKLSYLYNNEKWSFVSNAFGGVVSYDEVNPIFNKKADSNEFGINASFFLNNIFEIKNLSLLVSSSYAVSDSDIKFLKQSIHTHSVAFLYSF